MSSSEGRGEETVGTKTPHGGTVEEREAAHSLDAVFRPRSIAVVGASRSPGTVGHEVLRNLVMGGFQGRVYPVNPKADHVHSIRCHPSVRDLPEAVDLAVLTVPAPAVLEVARECSEKGVKALCVITAGFREIGGEGIERERALRDHCREHGMRLVGPNCMGVLNAEDDVRMDATIGPTFPRPGSVAFLSQSGAMGVSILNRATDLRLGISMFASIGNKADVSGNDLLRYWEHDDATKVVLMYLESFGNPRKFFPLARRISRTKPIVCVKAGRTAQGGAAASSHTGALAGADVAVDALLEQTGVLRVDTVGELFDVALALGHQPLPRGDRVAILTNAGGPAILAVDFLVGRGLRVAELASDTRQRLRELLVPEASVRNPVDMVAGAGADDYANALPLLLKDPGVDLVITIFVPPVHIEPRHVAERMFESARGADKPVLSCFMAREEVLHAMVESGRRMFPVYDFPEQAVRAAQNLVQIQRLREDDPGEPETFEDIDHEEIARLVNKRCTEAGCSERPVIPGDDDHAPLPERGPWLSAADVWSLLEYAGIPTSRLSIVGSADEAVEAARAFDRPVALKLDGPAFVHKSDLGAVVLDLEGDNAVRVAAEGLEVLSRRHAPDDPVRILVQPMVRRGTEVVVGARADPVFGPVLMVGLGGVHVETMKDVSFGVVPMTRPLARRMLRRLKAFPLLEGARGRSAADVEGIETCLLRLADVVARHPHILEVEINPLVARADGVVAVDARARVGTPFGPA